MNAKTIDLANIVLMIISCVAAFLLPFELFLFSYAVLGPLHYLTEISWLHDRSYFFGLRETGRSKRANLWLMLVVITLVVMLFGVISEKVLGRMVTPIWEIALFYLVFVASALLIFV